MAKKIVIIQGHPSIASYNYAIGEAYKRGALEVGAEVREIAMSKMHFDPNLRHGYQKRLDLEPDLENAWETIRWADHLVVVYPTWWGTLPAKLKGFFDRLFLPGMAFRYRENSPLWDRLLKGRSARIITTMDTPRWFFWLVYRNAGYHLLKRSILNFCGIRPVKIMRIGPIRNSSEDFRARQLRKVESLGRRLA